MLPGTSPNDPVFFLNHAKEDELWAVWTQKHQGVPHYLPLDSEPLPAGHTHLKRLSDHMDALAEYFGGEPWIERSISSITSRSPGTTPISLRSPSSPVRRSRSMTPQPD